MDWMSMAIMSAALVISIAIFVFVLGRIYKYSDRVNARAREYTGLQPPHSQEWERDWTDEEWKAFIDKVRAGPPAGYPHSRPPQLSPIEWWEMGYQAGWAAALQAAKVQLGLVEPPEESEESQPGMEKSSVEGLSTVPAIPTTLPTRPWPLSTQDGGSAEPDSASVDGLPPG